MKKMFFAALILVAAATQPLMAAGGTDVKREVRLAFEKEFSAAQAVNWESLPGKSIYHATFTINNERLHAYYDADGQLLVTGREVKAESLPLLITRNLANQYGTYTVSDVVEINNGLETSYIFKVSRAQKEVYVQGYTDGTVTKLKKSGKF